jgi:hypothetical protein
MKLTLIRDRQGNIIAAVRGHVADRPSTERSSEGRAGPMAVDGQTFENVDAPDEFAELRSDPNAFGRRLKEYFGHCSCRG